MSPDGDPGADAGSVLLDRSGQGIVRAQTLTLKERDFVIAAIVGVSHVKIILKHIIPNMTTQIIVAASLSIAGAILDESALSYLGYGVALPRRPGSSAPDAQQYILYDPLLALIPGMFILLTVLCFNILGDVLRSMRWIPGFINRR